MVPCIGRCGWILRNLATGKHFAHAGHGGFFRGARVWK